MKIIKFLIIFFIIIFIQKKSIAKLPHNLEEIIENEKKILFNEQYHIKQDIINIIKASSTSEGLINKIASSIFFDIYGNTLFFLPIVDSSKDLGINYGIMPVLALKDKKTQNAITSVIAPSLNYNKYLGYTYSYRHYIFPTEKTLIIARLSKSQYSQQEIFLRYYEPELFKTKIRLNIEFRNWHNPKSSFYGYGITSSKSNRANYTFYLKGGEVSLTIPIRGLFYFDITPSYYIHKISDGVIKENKFSYLYPNEYSLLHHNKKFLLNKFSLLFDATDHPFLPKIGTYIIFSFLRSQKGIISDYTYSIYSIEIKDYYNYKDKSVTAIRFLIEWQTGEKIPFYKMPQVGESSGLRMAGDGRFIDKARMLLNIEQRFTTLKTPVMKFLTEFEITPFIDIATVASSITKISTKNLKYGPGIATRILLRPQIVGTADFAFGSEGVNTIVKINYPF
ncbi:MAG: BamA/TamA family outer membrane protein [Elusimicrobiales bacterium]|nr:BamA/TamA family outer membrane protein [Elusimicrobiales bacterium]